MKGAIPLTHSGRLPHAGTPDIQPRRRPEKRLARTEDQRVLATGLVGSADSEFVGFHVLRNLAQDKN